VVQEVSEPPPAAGNNFLGGFFNDAMAGPAAMLRGAAETVPPCLLFDYEGFVSPEFRGVT